MTNNLYRLSNRVHDEASFREFLEILMKDRRSEANKEKVEATSFYEHDDEPEWQNFTIEDFLESAINWAQATENVPQYYSIPPNPWRRAAQIILAGKTKAP